MLASAAQVRTAMQGMEEPVTATQAMASLTASRAMIRAVTEITPIITTLITVHTAALLISLISGSSIPNSRGLSRRRASQMKSGPLATI